MKCQIILSNHSQLPSSQRESAQSHIDHKFDKSRIQKPVWKLILRIYSIPSGGYLWMFQTMVRSLKARLLYIFLVFNRNRSREVEFFRYPWPRCIFNAQNRTALQKYNKAVLFPCGNFISPKGSFVLFIYTIYTTGNTLLNIQIKGSLFFYTIYTTGNTLLNIHIKEGKVHIGQMRYVVIQW